MLTRTHILVWVLSLCLAACSIEPLHLGKDGGGSGLPAEGVIGPAMFTLDPTEANSSAALASPPITLSRTPEPTASPRPTATKTPEPSPTPSVTTTATETLTPTALPPRAYLEPVNHQWQSLNNCHRASIAILMAYYDVWFTQHDHDLAMDNLDEFLVPYNLGASIYAVTYAQVAPSYVVRWLLAEGVPVIMGQDLSTEDNTWHYRVVHGYDDQAQEFTIDDPLLGPGLRLSYDTFDRLSRGKGHIIPVYPREMETWISTTMKAWQMKRIIYP